MSKPAHCVARLFLLINLSLLILANSLAGQEPEQLESYIRLHYTKHEAMVPMRDGVKLMTSVFVPRDTTKTYPILIKRRHIT
ncbi:MAG: hypothetical protein R3C56_29280 [Pirellulaceae bacterium]